MCRIDERTQETSVMLLEILTELGYGMPVVILSLKGNKDVVMDGDNS